MSNRSPAVQRTIARYAVQVLYAAGRLGKRLIPSLPSILVPPGSRRLTRYNRFINQTFAAASGLPELPFSLSECPPPPHFAVCESPELSVVVSSWNGLDHTLRCLASIARFPPCVAFEVIVVDDCSTDPAVGPALDDVKGIRLVQLDSNHGYLKATNVGASHARAGFTVLLNNDVQVTEGCLQALFDRAMATTRPAIVGARLVYPTGRLQEAGSIVWSDGSGWNYGHGAIPSDAEYRYLREVDYCSAACLLVPTARSGSLFDPRFEPAYYEDTDLGFSTRQRGGIVLYEPRAVAYHVEGVSHGTDVSSGIKKHQEVNKRRFEEKWSAVLQEQYPPSADHVELARDRRPKGHIVVFDDKVPTPAHDSGSVRMIAMLQALVELGHPVHFVPSDRSYRPPYGENLEALGVELLESRGSYLRFVAGLGEHVTTCIVSRPIVAAAHMRGARRSFPNATLLYDMVDFHWLRDRRLMEIDAPTTRPRAARTMARLERRALMAADAVIAVSDEERELVASELDKPVYTITNIHEVEPEPATPSSHRSKILFVGSFAHSPNVDAARWILDDIAPRLNDRLPGVTVEIAGADAPAELIGASPVNVNFLGWLPSLDSAYHRARVAIAPLRAGAGMKGKVGEAMARGVPVVTTHVGAEGFGATEGELLVADNVEEFVDLVVQLFEDDALWTAVSRRGKALIDERFSKAVVRDRIAAIVNDVSGRRFGKLVGR